MLLRLGVPGQPRLAPLPADADLADMVGVPFFSITEGGPQVVLGYVPRDLPGIDLQDPRSIRYRDPADGHLGPDVGFVDYLDAYVTPPGRSQYRRRALHDRPGSGGRRPPPHGGVRGRGPAGHPDRRRVPHHLRVGEPDGHHHAACCAPRTSERSSVAVPSCCRTRRTWCCSPSRWTADTWRSPVRCRRRSATSWGSGSPSPQTCCHWGKHRPVALPRPVAGTRRGSAPASCRSASTRAGSSSTTAPTATNRYGMGALLLDADDPATVLARTPEPLLVPEVDYERDGFLHNVVFPSGHVDARRRSHPRLLRRLGRVPGCRRLRDRATSWPSSNRAETARTPHTTDPIRRSRCARRSRSTPMAATKRSPRGNPGSRGWRAWTTRRACWGCCAGYGITNRRRRSMPGRAACSSSCCGCRSRTDDG